MEFHFYATTHKKYLTPIHLKWTCHYSLPKKSEKNCLILLTACLTCFRNNIVLRVPAINLKYHRCIKSRRIMAQTRTSGRWLCLRPLATAKGLCVRPKKRFVSLYFFSFTFDTCIFEPWYIGYYQNLTNQYVELDGRYLLGVSHFLFIWIVSLNTNIYSKCII